MSLSNDNIVRYSKELVLNESQESLEFDEYPEEVVNSQVIRQSRRTNPPIVGIRQKHYPYKNKSTSGFAWKRKWQIRRERSKEVNARTALAEHFLLNAFRFSIIIGWTANT